MHVENHAVRTHTRTARTHARTRTRTHTHTHTHTRTCPRARTHASTHGRTHADRQGRPARTQARTTPCMFVLVWTRILIISDPGRLWKHKCSRYVFFFLTGLADLPPSIQNIRKLTNIFVQNMAKNNNNKNTHTRSQWWDAQNSALVCL